MNIRKNVVLEPRNLKQLGALLEMHEGNLSAAIRNVIEFTSTMVECYGSMDNALSVAKESMQRPVSLRDSLIEDGYCTLVDNSILYHLLKRSYGRILDYSIVEDITGDLETNLPEGIEKYLNERFHNYGWPLKITISCDDQQYPIQLGIMLAGTDLLLKEFMAKVTGMYLAKTMNMGIAGIYRTTPALKMKMEKKDTFEEAYAPIVKTFGMLDNAMNAIERKTDFWNAVINAHENTGYHMVTLHRNDFEDLMANKTPTGSAFACQVVGLPSSETFYPDFLMQFKVCIEASRLVDSVEFFEGGMRILHSYRDEQAIDTLIQMLVSILASGGMEYTADQSMGLITLRPIDVTH